MGRVKFTPIYHVNKGGMLLKTTISRAIKLTYDDGSPIPEEIIYSELYKIISALAERYKGDLIASVGIRVFYTGYIDKVKVET